MTHARPWPPPPTAARPPTAADVGTGWLFTPPEVAPMLAAVTEAVRVWRHEPDRWRAMQVAAMGQDLSWDRAAEQYEAVAGWALIDPPRVG